MSVIIRQAAVIDSVPTARELVAYSSDKKLIGHSFDLRVSSKVPKKETIEIKFVKMGTFQIEPLRELKRSNLAQAEMYAQLCRKQAQMNILNQRVWNGPNPLDKLVAFTKNIAQLYEITSKTTVALFSEPFKNAWAFSEAVEALKSPKRGPDFYA